MAQYFIIDLKKNLMQPQVIILEDFPYKEAQNYNKFSSIAQTYPHLSHINSPSYQWESCDNIDGVVIRSNNDDNVHKAIKYGVWTTTKSNIQTLNFMFARAIHTGRSVYLFFTTNGSGMFQGVAKLISGLNEESFPYWWQDYSSKFKGHFELQWIYIQDVNYQFFPGCFTVNGNGLTHCKDCEIIDPYTTLEMLQIYKSRIYSGHWIFYDFQFMDVREKMMRMAKNTPKKCQNRNENQRPINQAQNQ